MANDTHFNSNNIFELYKNPEELFSAAKENSRSLEGVPFRETFELYYILRYLVAIYEVRIGKIPIQVWNEHRMALDHFMRHVANLKNIETAITEDHPQLQKMKGHLQRAVLDMCKLIAYGSDARLKQMINMWGHKTLSLIKPAGSTKSILEILLENRRCAESTFEKAKVQDFGFGTGESNEQRIISKYLSAAYSYSKTLDILFEYRRPIEKAMQEQDEQSTTNSEIHDAKTWDKTYKDPL
jgi:hypothetical protein